MAQTAQVAIAKRISERRERRLGKAKRPTGVTAKGWPEGRAPASKSGEGAKCTEVHDKPEPDYNAA